MREVRWIKLSVDLFDNRKIKYLRRLPEGDRLALIWVMLLTLAGQCNAGGAIFFTETIPYTVKMLAEELGVEENTMALALRSFEYAQMIALTEDGFLFILGWEDEQNTEGLEKIREQNRLRKQRYDARQKALTESNAAGNVTVTQSNAPDIEREEEKEEEKEKGKKSVEKKSVKAKKPFVPPTAEEVKAYCTQRKSTVDPRRFWEYFDAGGWIDSGGNPVRNWKQKLITWENHTQERGGQALDSRADTANGASEWKIQYTLDGREA